VVIADSHGNYLENFTLEELIDFLFSKRYHGKWNFFWNLCDDFGRLLNFIKNN
jgi:hypothetical protein